MYETVVTSSPMPCRVWVSHAAVSCSAAVPFSRGCSVKRGSRSDQADMAAGLCRRRRSLQARKPLTYDPGGRRSVGACWQGDERQRMNDEGFSVLLSFVLRL